jgi:hypothetical protein
MDTTALELFPCSRWALGIRWFLAECELIPKYDALTAAPLAQNPISNCALSASSEFGLKSLNPFRNHSLLLVIGDPTLSCKISSRIASYRTKRMATYVLKCESCNGQKPFLVHDGEIPDPEGNKPLLKHCPVCRTTTNWMLAFPERRGNRERRQGSDRRTHSH